MPMYSLIEYSDNYSKTSRILWQYCRDQLALANNGENTDFDESNDYNNSFKIKKITGETGNNVTKNVEIMVPLKYISNLWRTHDMPLINCEINLDLILTNVAAQTTTFSITDTKLYVPVITLSTQDNAKLNN